MKTSTKILVISGSVLVGIMLICAINSAVQYHRLRPQAARMCAALDKTPIYHLEVDVSAARYSPSGKRWEGREVGPWIVGGEDHREFFFGANLPTSHIEGHTLYIKALHDDLSWRPNVIRELCTATVITADDVINTSFKE